MAKWEEGVYTKRSLDVVDSFIVNVAEESEGDVLIEEGSKNFDIGNIEKNIKLILTLLSKLLYRTQAKKAKAKSRRKRDRVRVFQGVPH